MNGWNTFFRFARSSKNPFTASLGAVLRYSTQWSRASFDWLQMGPREEQYGATGRG